MVIARDKFTEDDWKHVAGGYALFSLALILFATLLAVALFAGSGITNNATQAPRVTDPAHSANVSSQSIKTTQSESLTVNGKNIKIPHNGSVNETVNGSSVRVNSSNDSNSSSLKVDVTSGGGG